MPRPRGQQDAASWCTCCGCVERRGRSITLGDGHGRWESRHEGRLPVGVCARSSGSSRENTRSGPGAQGRRKDLLELAPMCPLTCSQEEAPTAGWGMGQLWLQEWCRAGQRVMGGRGERVPLTMAGSLCSCISPALTSEGSGDPAAPPTPKHPLRPPWRQPHT